MRGDLEEDEKVRGEKEDGSKELAMNAVNLAITSTLNINTGSHLMMIPRLTSGN